jgi:endonuclease YncB( thermonuclease family)
MTRFSLLIRSLTVLVWLFLAVSGASADFQGRVVGISDGYTFTLLTPGRNQIKVRLAEIDAPESGQPYGQKSKQALSDLVFGKNVVVRVQTTDRYGRKVGRPFVGDLDVCEEMVRIGAAWAYRQYLRDENLLAIEAEAKAEKRGLWGLSEAENVPPWEWRRNGGNPVPSATPGECQIKGNINSKGGRIYHVPGSRYYSQTRINTSKGERWFCSEAAAWAAGWRAPRD